MQTNNHYNSGAVNQHQQQQQQQQHQQYGGIQPQVRSSYAAPPNSSNPSMHRSSLQYPSSQQQQQQQGVQSWSAQSMQAGTVSWGFWKMSESTAAAAGTTTTTTRFGIALCCWGYYWCKVLRLCVCHQQVTQPGLLFSTNLVCVSSSSDVWNQLEHAWGEQRLEHSPIRDALHINAEGYSEAWRIYCWYRCARITLVFWLNN